MKYRRASFSLFFIFLVYVLALVYVDSKHNIFSKVETVFSLLPLLLMVTFFSLFIRYCRWHWLLARSGNKVPFIFGYLSYLSGFAFTATPGKVGELLRIRYFSRLGVKPSLIVSAFIFERFFDLLVILLIASIVASKFDFFPLIIVFVFSIISFVLLFAKYPQLLFKLIVIFRHCGFYRSAKVIRVLMNGIKGIKIWGKSFDVCIAFLLGLLAWFPVALSFCWLLIQLGINIPFTSAISNYPLAMLVGAASMLPGGLVSTEASVITQLVLLQVDIGLASIAAITIRFVTLWFAILCGFLSILVLEPKRTQVSNNFN
ncbi:MAG: lysylphosphatidylglycerol synthase transmembrane domain-containing protein [Pseudomonadota bacterium]